MKRLIVLLLLLLAALAAALFVDWNLGNVTIWAPPYRIDLSLQSAIMILLLGLVAAYLVYQVMAGIVGIPARIRNYRRRREQAQRLLALSNLVLEFFEGRFSRVTKGVRELATQPKLAQDSPAAVSAALALGASAAHQLRDRGGRQRWLDTLEAAQAGQRRPHQAVAALLRAQFALDERKGAQALAALAPLTGGDQRHVHTLRLALRAHQQQSNWSEVVRMSRLLENRKAISAIEAARYQQQAASAWIMQGRDREARQLLEASLKRHWDSGLCMLYAQCQDNTKEQLAKLEEWVQQHPLDPELNWALGKVCQRQRLWGKARRHLEASLRAKPMVQTHLALAEIAEELDEKETAAFHWKAAARLEH